MFTQDRDLLAFEPDLFRDIIWLAQRPVRGAATVAGDVVTFTTIDTPLDDAHVAAGDVVTVNAVPLEVIETLGPTTLRASRPRPSGSDPAIPPPAFAGAVVSEVVRFTPQRRIAHGQVLALLGLGSGAPGAPSAAAVTNADAIKPLEALAALHMIWSAASAPTGPDSHAGQRAEDYRQRFQRERARVVAELDLDGDGSPDVARRPNVHRLTRG